MGLLSRNVIMAIMLLLPDFLMNKASLMNQLKSCKNVFKMCSFYYLSGLPDVQDTIPHSQMPNIGLYVAIESC